MAKITNLKRFDFSLPSGHIVPGFGTLETTNEVIRSIDNWRVIPGMKVSGDLEYEMDEDPVLPAATESFERPAQASAQESPMPVAIDPVVFEGDAEISPTTGAGQAAAGVESPAAAMQASDPVPASADDVGGALQPISGGQKKNLFSPPNPELFSAADSKPS